MAAPEGYSLLARIGFVDRGNYSSSATYLAGDVVYYNGSSWKALKDNLKGVVPVAGANWGYMAKGFASVALSGITAKDTSGLKGTAGAQVDAQALMDIIADKVATKLLAKTDLVSQIVNDATKAASMAALYSVKQQVDQQNSDLTLALDGYAVRRLGYINPIKAGLIEFDLSDKFSFILYAEVHVNNIYSTYTVNNWSREGTVISARVSKINNPGIYTDGDAPVVEILAVGKLK